MRDEAIQEAAGHVTNASAQLERLVVEVLAGLRTESLNLPLTLPRETWKYYFAGQALAGFVAGEPPKPDYPQKAAEFAAETADALLAELEKEPRE